MAEGEIGQHRGKGEGFGWFTLLAHCKPVNQESISNLKSEDS